MTEKLEVQTAAPRSLFGRRQDAFSRARRTETRIAYLFLIPTLIGYTLFIIYPLITSSIYAFTDWNGLVKPHFVGFRNFVFMFTKDPTFYPSLKASLYYVVLTVPFTLIFGFLLAVLLNKSMPLVKMFRTLYYLPTILPGVASMYLFKYIFAPNQTGLANQLLGLLGIENQLWLSSPTQVMPSLLIYALWGVGGGMIIFLSGLQSVPAELYEAATMDGASGFHKMFAITIPMVSPVLFLQLITGMIGAFQVITPALLMTNNGGPKNVTYFLNFAIYTSAFTNRQYGYAFALVWIMFFFVMFFTAITFKVSNQFVYYENDNG